ncbi:hypothetical protein ACEWY4_009032 [Coilia grayii]|uniref:Gypsy retrotransposon integrase-like protein 1 n=1 Tax=Coilia grayii TaxID=363190 RepID=A0ABD1K5A5_9TELE
MAAQAKVRERLKKGELKTKENQSVDEVQDYSSTNFNLGSVDENLLSFWKAQGQTFPRLQHLAKRILSIPATSAASERSFSAAGRVIEARRSRLNPDTVDAILFLHTHLFGDDQAFAACRRLEAAEHRGPNIGVARLRASDPIRLAPQTETAVWAYVPEAPRADQEDVLLEDCYYGGQEWCVGRAVTRLREGRVLLRVCNPHPYPVVLPPRRPLARVMHLGQDDIQELNQLVMRQEADAVVEVDVRPVSSPFPTCLSTLLQQTEGLTPSQSNQLRGLLERCQKLFAQDEEDYGRTDAVYHTIPTGDAAPIRQRYRPVPPNLYNELRTLLRDMLDSGVIRESASPWAAPTINADALSRLPEAVAAVTAVTSATVQQVDAPSSAVEGSWLDRQGQDLELAKIRQWRQDRRRPIWEERQSLQPAGRQLLGEWERLEVRDGVLVRRHLTRDGLGEGVAIVAPAAEKKMLWDQYHAALGHVKGSRLLMAPQERLFWIGMSRDSHQWAQECPQCVLGRPEAGPRAPLCSIASGYPWETLALDYFSWRRPEDSHQYILVIVDLFSRFAFAVPTTDQTAATTAKVLWGTVFQPFGCPERILTDQGATFEADLMQQLCELYGCRKVRTTPYHPQGNGACERINQTILSLLNTPELREQPRCRSIFQGLCTRITTRPTV